MWKRTLEDLGFSSVTDMIHAFALSDVGRQRLKNRGFFTEPEALRNFQDHIDELLYLMGLGKSRPRSFPSLEGIETTLERPQAVLEGTQLYDLSLYIDAAGNLWEYCTSTQEPERIHLIPKLLETIPQQLLEFSAEVQQTLEPNGQVKDSHPRIRALKKALEQKRTERQRYSSQMIKTNTEVMQGEQPVYRDGRVVLPVRTDRKSEVDGFVHGASSSGSTLFIEPYKLVELNNSVVLAEQQILIETAKILSELTTSFREYQQLFLSLHERVGVIDELYACSCWAVSSHCNRVQLSQGFTCNLIQARHPLLKHKAVPITVTTEPETRAVVISGPNAGGKTVTVKTLGLFALLHQYCGFVPAAEGSQLPIFDGIYTDIGDDQSIEDDLSTFSGHMRQISKILNHATAQSLVILDELGSGTDPLEGSAIARAVLEYCIDHIGITLITSHHGVLKQFAYAHESVVNASMEFNEITHVPTFKVISGIPGESHAIETARRMQMPPEVVRAAEAFVGSEAVEISTIIKGLEQRRREAEAREAALQKRYLDLQDQVRNLDLKALQLNQKEVQLMHQQIGNLDRFIEEKRRELEHLVADLRTGEITREKTKKVKQYIASLEEKERQARAQKDVVQAQAVQKQLERAGKVVYEPGMEVLCGAHKREGQIIRASGKDSWLVAIGPMKFTLKETELSPAKDRSKEKKVAVSFQSSAPRPKTVLDVRGNTLSETLEKVALEIESCLVHAVNLFSIIHGYGDGILSAGITDYLQTHPSVKRFYYAMPEDGGMGKTYVEL